MKLSYHYNASIPRCSLAFAETGDVAARHRLVPVNMPEFNKKPKMK